MSFLKFVCMKMPTFLLLLLLLNLKGLGQDTYSPTHLRQDLDSLVYQIEAAHPNPYYRYSKSRFYKDIKYAKAQFHKSMNYMEFYFVAQRLVAKLEDGHIDMEMPIGMFKKTQINSFPNQVTVNAKKPFILVKSPGDQRSTDITEGCEILSINDISAQKISKDIVSLVTGESVEFRAKYGSKYFDFFLNQLYPQSGFYKISYSKNNEIKSITISGKPVEVIKKAADTLVSTKIFKEPFNLKIVKQATALMTLSDFIDMGKFKVFADSAFEHIKNQKVDHLIIDLRDNLGGDSDVGDYLLQYLLNIPFRQYDNVIAKNSQLLKNRLLSHRIGKQLSHGDTLLLSKRNGTIDTLKSEPDALLKLPNRFYGKVSLLINTQTFSSAADFAQAFSFYNRGMLIGQETGGFILSFGDIVPGTLPHTKMPFVVSSKLYLNIGAKVGDWHGVIPTIPTKSNEALVQALILSR